MPTCCLGAGHHHRATGPVVFDGVGQQVDQHLFEPYPVGQHQEVGVQRFVAQGDAALMCLRLDHGAAIMQHASQCYRHQLQRQFARLDQRQVQDFIDEVQQVPACQQNLVQAFFLGRCGAVCANQLGKPENGVQRRAQFMAHAGQKI